MTLNWIDYTIIGVVTLSSVVGLARGFVREALSLVVWIIAFGVCFRFTSQVAALPHVTDFIANDAARFVACFIGLFILVLVVGWIVARIIFKIMHAAKLHGSDRLLGFIFGIARGILLIGAVILLVSGTRVVKSKAWKQSDLIPQLKPFVELLHDWLPDEAESYFIHLDKTLEDKSKEEPKPAATPEEADAAATNS